MPIHQHQGKQAQSLQCMPAHVAPAGDVESPGHAVQDPPPDASLYVPASHAVHGPPLGPVYPAMHSQSPLESLPATTCTQVHTPGRTCTHTHTHTHTHTPGNLPLYHDHTRVRVLGS